MDAWMPYRGMPRREAAEMAGVMPLLEHGLMMPAMLVPVLVRLDFYTGRAAHPGHAKAEG